MSIAIFSSEFIAALRRNGQLRYPSEPGWMEISLRELQDFGSDSSSGSGDSAYFTAPTASPSSTTSQQPSYLRLPTHLHSKQTFEFLGFTAQLAGQFITTWNAVPAEEQVTKTAFLDIATTRIHDLGLDAGGMNGNWRGIMTTMGFTPQFQDDIMAPEFAQVRLTQSCKFWVLDTLQERLDSLKYVRTTSQAVTSSNQQPGASRNQRMLSLGTMLHSVPGVATQTSIAENAPGFTTLWKGTTAMRLQTLSGPDGAASKPGWQILMSGRNDFCRNPSNYFAVDREIAVVYANYVKKRGSLDGPKLLRIAAPNNVLEQLSPPVLTSENPLWKQLVWHARNNEKFTSSLAEFSRVPLIIGHILDIHQDLISNISSPEQIPDRWIMKRRDNGFAPQYAFCHDAGLDFLLEHCSKAGTFSIHSPSDPE